MRDVAIFLKQAHLDHYVGSREAKQIRTFQRPPPNSRMAQRQRDQAVLTYNTLLRIEEMLKEKNGINVKLESVGKKPSPQYLVFEANGPEGKQHLEKLQGHLNDLRVQPLNANQSKITVKGLTAKHAN